MNTPLVSVVITTFNRYELLSRAIDSVLSQDFPNLEIIVSDDCSDVDVKALIDEKKLITTIPIIYRRNEINSGACYTRNEGIKIASGFFIAGLDDDDEFTPDRISHLINNYNSDYAFITSNTKVITKKKSHPLFSLKFDKIISYENILWENLIGTQVLVEKSRLIECGGFDLNLKSAQDADMWVRLIKRYGPALRLKGMKYILHTEHEENRISVSSNKLSGLRCFYQKHSVDMSYSQDKYARFKFKIWSKNKSLNFKDFMMLDFNCLIFIFKKKFRLL